MFDPELTSEDRLLKIIEGSSVPKDGVEAPRGSGRGDFKVFWARIRSGKFEDLLRGVRLRTVNKVVILLCGLLTLACLVNFSLSKNKFEVMFSKISLAVPAKPEVKKKSVMDGVNFQQALAMAKQHNIFTLDRPLSNAEGVMVGESQEIANFKLVGIMWSEKPQAMVEDIVEQKTYLLSVGDQAGRLTVKEILKDKVVLGRDEHIWELR